jgi:N utilization substance protein A
LREYVKAAVSPAETSEIKIDKERKKIEVVVADDQLSIGIGKHGQNIRLASKLVGWEMDIRGKEDKVKAIFGEKPSKEASAPDEGSAGKEGEEAARVKLTDIDGVGPKVERTLIAAGYDTVEKIKCLTVEDLIQVEGIGKKTAEKIIKQAKEI